MTQKPGRAQPAWPPLPNTVQGPSADKSQASHQKLLYFLSKLLTSLACLISCQDQLFSPLHHYHRAYIISWQITRTDEWLFGLQLSGEYKMLPAVQSPGTASGQRLSWGAPALLGLVCEGCGPPSWEDTGLGAASTEAWYSGVICTI